MEAWRAFVRWFFGTTVVFPTIAYVFSGAGIYKPVAAQYTFVCFGLGPGESEHMAGNRAADHLRALLAVRRSLGCSS